MSTPVPSPSSRLKEESSRLKSRLQTLLPKNLNLNKSNASGAAIAAEGAKVAFSPEEMLAPAIVKGRDPGPDGETARFPSDPLVDDEILASVDPEYYDPDLNASLHELKKLPPLGTPLDQATIHADRQRLLSQLTVVTKRAFANILSQQSACAEEMERARETQKQLSEALAQARKGRQGLAKARLEFTDSSLGLLAACRRRQRAAALLEDLSVLATLHKTDGRVQEMLSEEDFPGAISLLLEAKEVAANYERFTCVKALGAKMQDTLEMAEEQLDVALGKVCVDFGPTLYSRVAAAYRLLGKTQTSMDQLGMHVTSTVHNTAWNVVFGHAALSAAQGTMKESDLSKKTYPDLCGCIDPSHILPCLVDLCRALWAIMNSYRQIVEWHREEKRSASDESKETSEEALYIERKLETGKTRIWQDVQTKAKVLVLANDLSGLSIDAFLEFCDVIHRLIEVGHTFCGSASDTLQESLKRQCWSYFHSYHLARLEELKMHLDNEGWARCPVKPTFKTRQLQEFRHIQSALEASSPRKKSVSSPRKVAAASNECPFDLGVDDSFMEEDPLMATQDEEGFYSEEDGEGGIDSDEELDDELKRDFVEEEDGNSHQVAKKAAAPKIDSKSSSSNSSPSHDALSESSPVLTNTSLMLLRLFGRYLRLMRDLEPIAASVFNSMTQLLDFYVFAVFDFFTKELSPENLQRTLDPSLSSVLERVRLDLIKRTVVIANNANIASSNIATPTKATPTKPGVASLMADSPLRAKSAAVAAAFKSPMKNSPSKGNVSFSGDELSTNNSTTTTVTTGVVSAPSLSPAVDLTIPESLFGLSERFAAAESALFLASELSSLKTLLPGSCAANEDRYSDETLRVLPLLRRPVYMGVCVGSVNEEVILQMMGKVAWDIKDVKSQHSQYVDVMLRDFQIMSLRLTDVRKVLHVPLDVRKVLWEMATLVASHIFVEGFSSAKRCSNEGRALMQLDYRQFVVKLEKLFAGELRPVPFQDFVSLYVKAYYIPEADLEAWVKQHNTEYNEKQLVALVNCVAYSNNKTKQKLNSLISEVSGRIRR